MSTPATVQGVRDRFPQFGDSTEYSNERIQTALDDAALELTGWGSDALYTRGHALLAAHMLALGAIAAQSEGSNTGGVAGVNIPGQASIQFAQNAVSTAAKETGYSATRYGVEFYQLQKKVITPIRIF